MTAQTQGVQTPSARVLAALRAQGPLTRQGLAGATGLSPATIRRVLAKLVAKGLVGLAGNAMSGGGRRPLLYAYAGADLAVAGISVTCSGAYALVLGLDGTTLGHHHVDFAADASPEQRLQGTLELLDTVIARPGARLTGIGIGVPGVVSPDGVVTAIHELGWNQFALADLLSRRAGMPVVLENDANCLAVAEHRRGTGRGVDNMVALVARCGLGAGLITNGQLYRGLHHEAGEIGYLLVGPESLGHLFPDRGDLEQQLADDRATGSADELLDLTALAVSSLCVVLDPELVIVGCQDESDTASLISGVRERLVGRILRMPRIEPAALGMDAIAIGAALLAAPE